ncbi:MAG: FxDxF family PEP-CTERM protein [Methylotenera sp.]
MKNIIKLLVIVMPFVLGLNISTAHAANVIVNNSGNVVIDGPSVIPGNAGLGTYSYGFNAANAGNDGEDLFDTFEFILADTFNVTVFANTLSTGFNLKRVDLNDGAPGFNFISQAVAPGPFSFTETLGAGNYAINFKYALRSTGTYTGGINVAAVPEPETYAMLLAGLGLIGFTARRRKL